MAARAKKTEHSGAKQGAGAFYGRKKLAKEMSRRRRRSLEKRLIAEARRGKE
jgi:hypothetical protein